MSDRSDEDLLKQQIQDIMMEEQAEKEQDYVPKRSNAPSTSQPPKTLQRKKKHKALKVIGITLLSLIAILALILG
ncbi:MAG: hypothetical protein H6Q59_3239, partial [Firmicutes bacterium]|nr:hypothetical protein [Bacillota bacterium]